MVEAGLSNSGPISACKEVNLAKKGQNAQEGQEFLKCDVDSDTFDLQNGSDQ